MLKLAVLPGSYLVLDGSAASAEPGRILKFAPSSATVRDVASEQTLDREGQWRRLTGFLAPQPPGTVAREEPFHRALTFLDRTGGALEEFSAQGVKELAPGDRESRPSLTSLLRETGNTADSIQRLLRDQSYSNRGLDQRYILQERITALIATFRRAFDGADLTKSEGQRLRGVIEGLNELGASVESRLRIHIELEPRGAIGRSGYEPSVSADGPAGVERAHLSIDRPISGAELAERFKARSYAQVLVVRDGAQPESGVANSALAPDPNRDGSEGLIFIERGSTGIPMSEIQAIWSDGRPIYDREIDGAIAPTRLSAPAELLEVADQLCTEVRAHNWHIEWSEIERALSSFESLLPPALVEAHRELGERSEPGGPARRAVHEALIARLAIELGMQVLHADVGPERRANAAFLVGTLATGHKNDGVPFLQLLADRHDPEVDREVSDRGWDHLTYPKPMMDEGSPALQRAIGDGALGALAQRVQKELDPLGSLDPALRPYLDAAVGSGQRADLEGALAATLASADAKEQLSVLYVLAALQEPLPAEDVLRFAKASPEAFEQVRDRYADALDPTQLKFWATPELRAFLDRDDVTARTSMHVSDGHARIADAIMSKLGLFDLSQ